MDRAIPSRPKVWLGLAPLIAALALAACATDYGPPINGEHALSPEEQRLQAVENRSVELSRRLGALEGAQQGGANLDELRSLRGQVEQLRHDFDEAQQKNQQQLTDMDARLKRLEGGALPPPAAATDSGTPPPAAPAATSPAMPVQPTAPAPVAPPAAPAPTAAGASAAADEEAIYLKAFDQLKAAKYDDAIHGFRAMLEKYPHGNYSDNAWYWMGECYHIKGDAANALKSYQALLQSSPASPKVPDALLKTGVIYEEQQKSAQARETYQRVIKQYPTSNAATQARSRLARLK